MIRPIEPTDTAAVLELAVSSGLFPREGLDEVAELVASHLSGELGADHQWIVIDEGEPIGVAYFAPERLTEGTWNLYMIAVDPKHQRQGHGASLVHFVEESLADRGARLLLVETSGLGTFEQTRAFYRSCGYTEEARIREFYKAGEDKIVFRKQIGTR